MVASLNVTPGKLQTTRPPMRWTDDPFLANREAFRMLATGDYKIRPKAEVLEIDEDYEKSVLTSFVLLRFQQDAQKVSVQNEAPTE